MSTTEIEGWLTLSYAAARLGMPRSRLKKLEGAGLLHPRRDFLGRRRYNPAELDAHKRRFEQTRAPALARSRPAVDGAKSARAFRLFSENKPLREVVLELEIRPDDALELRRQYAEFGSDLLVGPAELEQLRELLDWHGDTAGSLVVAVNARLRRQYVRGREEAIRKPTEDEQGSQQKGKVNGERKKVHTGS